MTIHNYEYYHDSYMVSISVHKHHDWRQIVQQRNMQLSSIINVRLPLYSDFMKFCHIYYKILYKITIWIVRQPIILFMNSLNYHNSEYYHDNHSVLVFTIVPTLIFAGLYFLYSKSTKI